MSTVLPIFLNTNVNGIPAISSNSVTAGTAAVSYDFNNHRTVNGPFRGIIVVRLNQAIPAGTTDTLQINFTTNSGNAKTLTKFNGEPVTVADIAGTGIYLVWYESSSDTLQLLTGII
jgi:hypothetical protein